MALESMRRCMALACRRFELISFESITRCVTLESVRYQSIRRCVALESIRFEWSRCQTTERCTRLD